jgi:hypothetical protein
MKQILVSGYFLDEKDLLNAVKHLSKKEVTIFDVFSPFPVHGLDGLLGLKRSGIPLVGFIFGSIGAIGAFVFQSWAFTVSYPLKIGGKPYLSIPSFIPVVFETAILLAALAMFLVFLFRSKLGPGAENKIFDNRATDDRFIIVLDGQRRNNTEQLKEFLKEVGAQGIREEEI